MLTNNYVSHINPKFDNLANENHIYLYLFNSHLIHCMQLLDVGLFQLYKH